MLPLVKRGMTVEYTIGRETKIGKVRASNIKAVWIDLESGRVLKLHKRRHFIKVIEPSEKGKEEVQGEKPSKKLDDLFKDLPGGSS